MAREVEARLRLSAIDRTAKAFASVQNRLNRVEKQTGAVNRAQAAVNRTISAMPVGAYVGPAAIAYGAARAVGQFAKWEVQLERIGITAGASAAQTEKMGASLARIANDTALPIEEVVAALDTLVASGMSLDEAMAFLPSVTKTAQAAGAATTDIANTAQKAASALGLQSIELQRAFDIMVAGGKAGQFELRDMAQYIPGLANSFASLGYKGQEGLQQLIAVLQTIREDTGDASAAATQAQNIFGKMYSEETSNKFAKMGVNLRTEMEAAKAAGEDALSAFVRISKEAIDGDLSKLPLLFSDQEFRLGMQSLITSEDSFNRFLNAVNNAEVTGTVDRDFARIADTTQAKIQQMSNSWTAFVNNVGGGLSNVATPVLENLNKNLDREASYAAGVRKEEERGGSKSAALADYYKEFVKVYGEPTLGSYSREYQDMFMDDMGKFGRGEIKNPYERLQRIQRGPRQKDDVYAPTSQASAPQQPQNLPEQGPAPGDRPVSTRDLAEQYAEYGRGRQSIPDAIKEIYPVATPVGPSSQQVNEGLDQALTESGASFFEAVSAAAGQLADVLTSDRFLYGEAADNPDFALKDRLRVQTGYERTDIAPAPLNPDASNQTRDAGADPDALRQAMEGGGTSARQSIETGAQSIRDAAFEVNKAGGEAGSTFASMVAGIGSQIGRDMASAFNANVRIPTPSAPAALPRANANPGVTMPAVGTPGGSP